MTQRHDIPPITVPPTWINSHAVELVEDTRWYIERGPVNNFRHWLDDLNAALTESSGGLLMPMQWVPTYVGVSRAAVHKRANSGRLTVFSYIVTEYSKTLLGTGAYKESRQRYDLVPFAECRAWRELLQEYKNQLGED